MSGWVRRGRNLRTLSGPRGSSSKLVNLGAAGLPARTFLSRSINESGVSFRRLHRRNDTPECFNELSETVAGKAPAPAQGKAMAPGYP